MGIDKETYSVVSLLPLVQVAWSDGLIQQKERSLILHIASSSLDINHDGMLLLENWPTYRPSDAYLLAGLEVLSALSKKTSWENVSINTINDVIGFSWDVAKAAGGLFGFGRIESNEKDTLSKIAAHLKLEANTSFSNVFSPQNPFRETTEEIFYPEDLENGVNALRHVSFHLATPKRTHVFAHLIFSANEENIAYPIGSDPVLIGRSKECSVQLRYDGQASKVHCQIEITEGKWKITDLESVNGTFVNNQQISHRILLGGERIQVGSTAFTFALVGL